MPSRADASGRLMQALQERKRDAFKRGFREYMERRSLFRRYKPTLAQQIEKRVKEARQREREALAKGISPFGEPRMIRVGQQIAVIDERIANSVNKEQILDELRSVVQGKTTFLISGETEAYKRWLVARYKKPHCRSRHWSLKLTPLLIQEITMSGQYSVRRFSQVKHQRAPLIGRSEQVSTTMLYFINRKSFWDFNVSEYDAGITTDMDAGDVIVAYLDRKYNIKRTARLLNFVLRPHVAVYNYAKTLGVPENWQDMDDCSVYLNPRIGTVAELMFNYGMEGQQVYDFVKHKYKKYNSVRDIMQGA